MTRHPDVHVEVQTDASVLMNPLRARQLFTNLLDNAACHGGTRPLTVTIRSQSPSGGSVAVEVADDGVGIPEADRERIFQIFQRLKGFDASAPGSGIGLTMCRRIVEDAGGTIDVGGADRGAMFRVRLPVASRSVTVGLLQPTGAYE